MTAKPRDIEDVLRLLSDTQQEIEELRAQLAAAQSLLATSQEAIAPTMALVAAAFAEELNFDGVPQNIAARLRLSALKARGSGLLQSALQLEFIAAQLDAIR